MAGRPSFQAQSSMGMAFFCVTNPKNAPLWPDIKLTLKLFQEAVVLPLDNADLWRRPMTIGDILAVIAAVLLAGASWGATLIMTALLFPAAVHRAEERITTKPGACIGLGIGTILAVTIVAVTFHAAGPLRLISGALRCTLVL